MNPYAKILQGDAQKVLESLPSHLADCGMTSPPYWRLRNYGGFAGEIGQEKTPEEYIYNLCGSFDEFRRVLKPTGILFVNIADTIVNKRSVQIPAKFETEMVKSGWIMRQSPIIWRKSNGKPQSAKDRFTIDYEFVYFFTRTTDFYFKQQYEAYADATFRRMESCKRSQEAYDPKRHKTDPTGRSQSGMAIMTRMYKSKLNGSGRRMHSVWTLATSRSKLKHFAPFPKLLCQRTLDAGCPEWVCNRCGEPRIEIKEKVKNVRQSDRVNYKRTKKCADRLNEVDTCPRSDLIEEYRVAGLTDCGCNADFSPGTVLDPFCGTGTAGVIALRQGKNFIGIDLNPEYVRMAEESLGIAPRVRRAA